MTCPQRTFRDNFGGYFSEQSKLDLVASPVAKLFLPIVSLSIPVR